MLATTFREASFATVLWRRKILGHWWRSESQPLVTDPRYGCIHPGPLRGPKRPESGSVATGAGRMGGPCNRELRRIALVPRTPLNMGIKRAWLSSAKDRILRVFGTSALTTPVHFGGEALSPGGRSPLPYDRKRFAGMRGRSRCSRCHPPRSATSRAVRDP